MYPPDFIVQVTYYIQVTLDGACSHQPAQIAVDELAGFSRLCVGELWDRRSCHFTLEACLTDFIGLSSSLLDPG